MFFREECLGERKISVLFFNSSLISLIIAKFHNE